MYVEGSGRLISDKCYMGPCAGAQAAIRKKSAGKGCLYMLQREHMSASLGGGGHVMGKRWPVGGNWPR